VKVWRRVSIKYAYKIYNMTEQKLEEVKYEQVKSKLHRDSVLGRQSISNFSWGNSACVHFKEYEESPVKLRKKPEYQSVRFIIFPDDYLKIAWDLLILW